MRATRDNQSRKAARDQGDATKRTRCSPKSTTGSPRASILLDLKEAKALLDELGN